MRLHLIHDEESSEQMKELVRGTAPLLNLLQDRRARDEVFEEFELASQASSDVKSQDSAMGVKVSTFTRPSSVALNKLTPAAGLFAVKKSLFMSKDNQLSDKHQVIFSALIRMS